MSDIIPFPKTCRHHLPDAPCDTEPTLAEKLWEIANNTERAFQPSRPITAKQKAKDDLEDALEHFECVFGYDETKRLIKGMAEAYGD